MELFTVIFLLSSALMPIKCYLLPNGHLAWAKSRNNGEAGILTELMDPDSRLIKIEHNEHITFEPFKIKPGEHTIKVYEEPKTFDGKIIVGNYELSYTHYYFERE